MREPNGFSGFISEMPIFFKIFGGLLFILVVGSFLFLIIRGISIWISNNNAEIMTRRCKIVDKRTEVWGGSGESSVSTNYFITFEFEDNTRKELQVKANDYGLFVVGDVGELTYRGTRFLNFNRIIK